MRKRTSDHTTGASDAIDPDSTSIPIYQAIGIPHDLAMRQQEQAHPSVTGGKRNPHFDLQPVRREYR
jgi:hypothetical protein